jgi:N-acetylmuramoyl-L-alanine amidase
LPRLPRQLAATLSQAFLAASLIAQQPPQSQDPQPPAPPASQPQPQQNPQQALPAVPAPPHPAPPPRTLILIDPSHGGPDTGDHLDDHLLEKDYILSLATHLRPLLNSGGFAVIITRDADPAVLFTADQRAGIINHSHPAACILLHATSHGTGIHIFTSDLNPPLYSDEPPRIIPWDAAQSTFLPQSLRLANELGTAFLQAKIPVQLSQASPRPLNNVICPAIAIEVAPRPNPGSEPTPVADPAYQQQVLQAIVQGFSSWHTHLAAAASAAQTNGAPR